ncbi:MAG: AMP-binding protein, partial [Lachnospiraceae bacterium]|nr:AMP-binding protein [Lachnospiraceae bacterium]
MDSAKKNLNSSQKCDECLKTIYNGVREVEITEYDEADGKPYGRVLEVIPDLILSPFCKSNNIRKSAYLHAAFSYLLNTVFRENGLLYLTAIKEYSNEYLPVIADHKEDMPVKEYLDMVQARLGFLFNRDIDTYKKSFEEAGLCVHICFSFQSETRDAGGAINDDPDISTTVPVNILAYPEKDNIIVRCDYDGMKYGYSTIEGLLCAFKNAAINMTKAEYLSEVSLISEDDKERIIKLSSGETFDYDRSKTWLDLFKKQVLINGDKKAVTDSLGSYTYKEIDEISDRLSQYFVKKGVKERDFVILKMGRFKEYILAIIALHKIGAAYVPMDSDQPSEIMEYIRRDCEAGFIITKDDVIAALKEEGETDGKTEIKAT